MRLRKTYLQEDKTITDSGTEIFDLDFTDPVRELVLDFTGSRYDMADTNDPQILRDIDKIEVVDGSDVLYSCTGEQAAAVQFYHTGKLPFMSYSANQYTTVHSQIKVPFGRTKTDDKYGLDVRKFDNPQLKITYDFAEAESAGWDDNGQSVTVSALVAEGAPAPSGFMMTKEMYSFTKATSGDETIEMNRDYPYRFLVMQVKDCTTPVWNELNQVKLSCNYDEFVPINHTTQDIAMENVAEYGLQEIQYEAIGDGSDTDIKAYNEMAWNWGGWVNSWNYGQSAVLKRPYSGYSTIGRHTCPDSSGDDFTDTYLENAQRALVTHRGFEVFDTDVVTFGDIHDERDWFDPKTWKSVRLVLTQGGSDTKETNVVTQQVRSM